MERDPAFQERLLLEAAQSAGVDEDVAMRLFRLADKRAFEGPVETEGRDLVWEWIEEAADGVANYGAWELQRMMVEAEDNHEKHAELWAAVKYGLLMYACLLRAQRAEDKAPAHV